MIQFNFESAEAIATKMQNASDSVQSVAAKTITTADRTTLKVNQAAQASHKKAMQLTDLFHVEFQRFIQDIQSVASEFQRTDSEMDESIKTLTPAFDLYRDIHTYNKAKNG